LLLAFVFGRANRPAHRIVETAQLALGAGVHVAHPADYAMGLIVQIQRIGNQFLDIDLGRAFKAPPVSPISVTAAAFPAPVAMRTTASFPAATGRASALSPGFLTAWFLLRCFRHPNLVFFLLPGIHTRGRVT
jgi:hypothetical protein